MKLIFHFSKSILVFLLLLASAGASAQEISESLQSFSRLKASNGVNVKLVPSDENRLVIEGYDKEEVKYTVDGNQLDLRLSWDNVFSDSNTIVTVFFVYLNEIEANSKAMVELLERFESESMVFSAGEGANLVANVDAGRVSIKVTTGAHLQLLGKAEKQEGKVNTGGLYSGKTFETQDTELSIATGGRADVFASETCRVNAKLGGSIQVYGNPDKLDQKTSFGGSVSISE